MDTLDGLLGAVRVVDPELVVAELAPGPATAPTGPRRSLLAVARGRIRLRGVELGPGDALLLHAGGAVPLVAEEPTTLVVARFDLHGAAPRLLALPDEVLAPADSEFCRLLIERVADQAPAATAGDVVSARLLDWLVVETVRDVLVARSPGGRVADPGVAAALAAPLAYVRDHRLALAEHALLTEPDLTVAAVARRVGYANPFSFSTAFRRHRGVAPSEVRAS